MPPGPKIFIWAQVQNAGLNEAPTKMIIFVQLCTYTSIFLYYIYIHIQKKIGNLEQKEKDMEKS